MVVAGLAARDTRAMARISIRTVLPWCRRNPLASIMAVTTPDSAAALIISDLSVFLEMRQVSVSCC
jgi:hypothetical protein